MLCVGAFVRAQIKEISYVHAEGFSGGALKHGPFALLEQNTPVVHIILDDAHLELMKIAAAETKSRGSYNIVITDKPAAIPKVRRELVALRCA
jgi:glucosamine--fructose-6-phosphate aminotransferase (isomerizing)